MTFSVNPCHDSPDGCAGSGADSIGEDVCCQDVDLPPGVPEEGAESSCHYLERAFPSRAIGLPVVTRDDEEQMVRVGRYVRLPDVLQIMVVGGRTAPLDLGDDPATRSEAEEEVGSRLRHEPGLSGEDHLLAEPKLEKKKREMILNRLASGSVDMDGGNLVLGRDNVIRQTDCESIDNGYFGDVLRWNDGLDVPPVSLHELELRSPRTIKLVRRFPHQSPLMSHKLAGGQPRIGVKRGFD